MYVVWLDTFFMASASSASAGLGRAGWLIGSPGDELRRGSEAVREKDTRAGRVIS